MSGDTTTELQGLLDRLGDAAAREVVLRQLFEVAYERLRRLAAKILGEDFPRLKGPPGHVGTTEVTNDAVVRLYQAIATIPPPVSVRHFFRIAARNIRWILLDRARELGHPLRPVADNEAEPSGLSYHTPSAALLRLYDAIAQLPEPYREVVDLLYFHELTQPDAARLLGIDERTVRRRWAGARLKLYEALKDALPGPDGLSHNGHPKG